MKKGFTLAEVLITLSIIGVVAALTMPALLQNVGGAKIGPTLAKFVNTFESAAQSMMIAEEKTIMSNGNQYFDKNARETFRKYYPMTKLGRSDVTIEIQNSATKKVVQTIKGNHEDLYTLKDGTLVYFRSSDKPDDIHGYCNWVFDNGEFEPYKACIGSATVILNGLKGKHEYGKDVFVFYIDDTGAMLPCGSSAHREILAVDEYSTEICDRTSSDLNKQYSCTGAIADNNWKTPW